MTQDRPRAILHLDGSWAYYKPEIPQGNGLIVTPETSMLTLVNFIGIEKAQEFMGEFMVPLLYEHTFTYTFKVVTPLDDDRDIEQTTIHRALLKQMDADTLESMKEKINFIMMRKI